MYLGVVFFELKHPIW